MVGSILLKSVPTAMVPNSPARASSTRCFTRIAVIKQLLAVCRGEVALSEASLREAQDSRRELFGNTAGGFVGVDDQTTVDEVAEESGRLTLRERCLCGARDVNTEFCSWLVSSQGFLAQSGSIGAGSLILVHDHEFEESKVWLVTPAMKRPMLDEKLDQLKVPVRYEDGQYRFAQRKREGNKSIGMEFVSEDTDLYRRLLCRVTTPRPYWDEYKNELNEVERNLYHVHDILT